MTREWLNNNDLNTFEFNMDFMPKANNREKWSNISDEIKDITIKQAEKYIDFEFKSMLATDFLKFVREGNRGYYEDKALEKRNALASLVMGECVEYSGRFIDGIVNGIFSLCEESFWGVPAHNDGKALPNVEEPIIDIFAAQTAQTVCFAAYLLENELNEVAPQIVPRVKFEIENRMLKPFIESEEFWWMGYYRKDINNWNPWILSNLIFSFIIYNRIDCIEKALYILDPFLNYYSDTGSTDEGMTYWNLGALSLFDFLEVLYLSTNSKIDFFNETKIKNIFEFVLKMYIGKGQFVNFADCAPMPRVDIISIYRLGARINNSDIMALARDLIDYESDKNFKEYITLRRGVLDIFAYESLMKKQIISNKESYYYLPDIQILTFKKDNKFLAIKGGTNGENHNHNDVGSFIMYSNDEPVIIDMGAPFYDARSFSSRRYEIFANTSNYHNLPIVNGKAQRTGLDSKAENFAVDGFNASMLLDSCYDESVKREYSFENGRLSIKDSFDNADVQEVFVLSSKPIVDNNCVCVKDVKIACNYECNIIVETISLDDERLKNSWGNELYRVIYEVKNANEVEFEIG